MELAVDPYVGTVIADRYRILRKVGQGGMGAVYLAEHVLIEKKVALKILTMPGVGSEMTERFMQEARTSSMIDHPHVINVTDFGATATGSVFIAMEFLDGVDLAYQLRAHGPLSVTAALALFRQIGAGVEAAHRRGVLHRDLKPQNVFISRREDRDDFVKLLDFGIAKVLHANDERRRTREGFAVGTPEYMSPEQCCGEPLDVRADVYAAGCILYEMVSGRPPFPGPSPVDILHDHVFREPTPPSQVAPLAGISLAVERAILRALAKSRTERYESMAAFVAALEAAASAGSEAARTPTLPVALPAWVAWRKQLGAHRRALIAAAIVVAGAALLAATLQRPGARTTSRPLATPAPTLLPPVVASPTTVALPTMVAPAMPPTATVVTPAAAPAPSPAHGLRRPLALAPRHAPATETAAPAPSAPAASDAPFRKMPELKNPFANDFTP